jgi:predicted nucleotide-binding protein
MLARAFDRPDLLEEWTSLHVDQVSAQIDGTSKLRLLRQNRKEQLARLEGILRRLPYVVEVLPGQSVEQTGEAEQAEMQAFVVHGHDHAAKDSLARFLMKLGLDPIILAEQPNRGRTIIEKLEASNDVGFAVVLLTADDMGAVKDDTAHLQPRARQNVVLELGYFLGLLGREFVCPLLQEGVEKPSDYDGVVYIPLDEPGAWMLSLARELKAAGIDVDLNKAY